MFKSHVFAMLFLFVFFGGTMTPPAAPTPVAKKTVASKTVAKPASFRGLSMAEMAALSDADASVSETVMAKKGEVAKSDSTFTWEYFLIFAVIALGAFLTLLIAK